MALSLRPVLTYAGVAAAVLGLFLAGDIVLAWPALGRETGRIFDVSVGVTLAYLYFAFPVLAARVPQRGGGHRKASPRETFYALAAVAILALPVFFVGSYFGGRPPVEILRACVLLAAGALHVQSFLGVEFRAEQSFFPSYLVVTGLHAVALPFLGLAFFEFAGRGEFAIRPFLVRLSPIAGGPDLVAMPIRAHFAVWGWYLAVQFALALVWQVIRVYAVGRRSEGKA